MTGYAAVGGAPARGLSIAALNGRYHRAALNAFMVVVVAHWAEHLVQAMLVGLFLLRPGFVGVARAWWTVALVIQFWHHIEHLLLLIQAQTGVFFFGASVPTSVAQLVVPRVELHLFYNSIVFIPMMVAVYLHKRPNERDLRASSCACAEVRGAGREAALPAG